MTKFHIFREHHELLSLWRSENAKGLKILHLDFHDDLRGFLIDRRRETACRTGTIRPRIEPPDDGNFLIHAVTEGIIRRIRWVRGRTGGRAYEAGIVKYREDLASLPHRLAHFLRKDREYPLEFGEIVFEDWKGLEEGEHLDMDWDYFASFHLDSTGILKRFEDFLKKSEGIVPPAIYLCYSPMHVFPSKKEFLRAVELLSERCGCEPIWPCSRFIADLPDVPPPRKTPTLAMRFLLFGRKKGIY